MAVGRGIGYKPLPDVSRHSTHTYLDSKTVKGYAIWTLQDVIVLIAFLKDHVPGDGHKFKPAVLSGAETHLNQHLIKGGLKKAKGIKDKIRDLLAIYDAVMYLKTQVSGVHWDDVLGMDIGPEEEEIWEGIVAKHPDCAPFKHAGWEIFNDIAELKPSKPKG
ncbi:hypothetical protein EV360DRAFT_58102, partial [Lentinula raphanica]